MNLQLTTHTVARNVPDHYIHRTIASIRDSGYFDDPTHKFHVFTGSPDLAYLNRYKDDPSIVLHIPDRYPKYGMPAPLQGNWNFVRSVTPLNNSVTHILTIEDDVVFSLGWYEQLQKAVRVADEEYKEYGLTLYVYHVGRGEGEGPLNAYKNGEVLWKEYPPKHHACIQGILFPRSTAYTVSEYMTLNSVNKYQGENSDRILRHIFMDGVKLLATAPCLVQHIGKVGAGAGGGFHKSRFFVEDVRDV